MQFKFSLNRNNYDRSEAERVQFTNIVEDLVGELTRPDSNVFQTLVSQERMDLNGPKFHHVQFQL